MARSKNRSPRRQRPAPSPVPSSPALVRRGATALALGSMLACSGPEYRPQPPQVAPPPQTPPIEEYQERATVADAGVDAAGALQMVPPQPPPQIAPQPPQVHRPPQVAPPPQPPPQPPQVYRPPPPPPQVAPPPQARPPDEPPQVRRPDDR